MKIIVLGDVHIGKGVNIGKPGAGKELNSRIKDQINILDWVLNTAKENNVNNIIITGDVYEDPRPHPTLINYFMLWLKKCEREKVGVHIVAGNHDIIRTGNYTVSALDIVPSIEMEYAKTYKDITTVDFDDVSITFIPYRDRRMYEVETTKEALALLREELYDKSNLNNNLINIAIGHLALEGSISIGDEIDDELNEIFCPPNIFSHWRYTWMGHVHNPQVLFDKEYHVSHIGSMERSDFSKLEMTQDKHLILFDSEKPDSFEKIIIPNRKICKARIVVQPNKDTTDFVIQYLKKYHDDNDIKKSIIKIEIELPQEAVYLDRNKVLQYLYDEIGVHYVCHLSETRMISNVVVDSDFVINDTIDPTSSINAYWDKIDDIEDSEREECRSLSLKINKEYEEEHQL